MVYLIFTVIFLILWFVITFNIHFVESVERIDGKIIMVVYKKVFGIFTIKGKYVSDFGIIWRDYDSGYKINYFAATEFEDMYKAHCWRNRGK